MKQNKESLPILHVCFYIANFLTSKTSNNENAKVKMNLIYSKKMRLLKGQTL